MTRVSLSHVPLRENVQRSKARGHPELNTHCVCRGAGALIAQEVGYCVLILDEI